MSPPPPEIAAGLVEHPELSAGPTAHPELDSEEVKRRAIRGVGSMFVRALGQRGLQMVGNILLARWLAPKTIGLYAIVSFIVGFAGFLSDLGLGASLIQRRERLTEKDRRTAFTLNMLFNLSAVVVLWLLATPLASAYDAPSAVWPIRMLTLTIMFSTFTIVPAVQLERDLRFGRVAVAELAGQLAYLGIALTLAFPYWHHPGRAEANAHGAVWVFIWASLASRAIHTLLVNVALPWRPRLGMDRVALREMFRFGLPYQLNGFVNALKDNFVPIFVGLVAGTRAVGFIVWAVGLATNALFLLPIVQRVTFPTFARLQNDETALRESIEKAIKWVAATVIPTTFLMAALGRQIVEHVYGPKWLLGLPSFYLLCIPMINAAYSTVMVSALYGLGRAKTVLRLTLIWALAGWALGVPLTLIFNQNGFALAMSLVSWLSFMSVRELNKIVKVRFVPELLKICALAAIPAVPVGLFAHMFVHNAFGLAAIALLGGAVYVALMYATGELDEIKKVLHGRRARAVASEPVSSPEPAVEGA